MSFKKGFVFSIEEVFEIAKIIEKNGYNFYVEAAKICPEHSDFLLKMAEQERGHEKTFDNLAKKLVAEKDRYLSNVDTQEAMKYIKALADHSVFLTVEKPEDVFANLKNANQIFNEAIEREGKAILFFLGLKEMMIDYEGKKAIEHLIKEEMNHVTWIKEHRP